MSTILLIHATGLVALALNVSSLVRTSDSGLRTKTGLAAVLWTFNNLMLGATTGAALNAVTVGRQAMSQLTQKHTARVRLVTCAAFMVVILAVGVLTWHGWPTILVTGASLLSTCAMFYLQGARLRLAMLVVSLLWMYNAWAFNAWEQLIANVCAASAAALGAWRTAKLAHSEPPVAAAN